MTAVLALLAAGIAARWVVRRRHRRRRHDLDRALPGLASDLARAVRSGATLRVALGEVAVTTDPRLRPSLSEVLARVERGHPLDEALGEWARRRPSPALDLVVGACRFGDAHGGDLARALDGAGAAVLDTLELADEAAALSSQARTSALVLVALPPVGAAVFSMADPAVTGVLFGTAAGRVCLVVGLGLDALGLATSSWLVRVVSR